MQLKDEAASLVVSVDVLAAFMEGGGAGVKYGSIGNAYYSVFNYLNISF